MIAEVLPEVYDVSGRGVLSPNRRRFPYFAPNAPMGRYVTQPLTVNCRDLEDVRRFLSSCRYVSDRAQFRRNDVWMLPEEFEHRRQGDCEDFALWTWRQMLQLGYAARFVGGHAGAYGSGHAWVTFEQNGRTFILESLRAWLGPTFPRLSTLRYHPRFSVAYDGRSLKYFEHERMPAQVSAGRALALMPEWVRWWTPSRVRVWSRFIRLR
jgi:hypothetical protein